jgi:hypothetical protein
MSKAVVLTRYGPPDVLAWRDAPIPEPGPGQVRIRLKAEGVGPTDLKVRRGEVRFASPRTQFSVSKRLVSSTRSDSPCRGGAGAKPGRKPRSFDPDLRKSMVAEGSDALTMFKSEPRASSRGSSKVSIVGPTHQHLSAGRRRTAPCRPADPVRLTGYQGYALGLTGTRTLVVRTMSAKQYASIRSRP